MPSFSLYTIMNECRLHALRGTITLTRDISYHYYHYDIIICKRYKCDFLLDVYFFTIVRRLNNLCTSPRAIRGFRAFDPNEWSIVPVFYSYKLHRRRTFMVLKHEWTTFCLFLILGYCHLGPILRNGFAVAIIGRKWYRFLIFIWVKFYLNFYF